MTTFNALHKCAVCLSTLVLFAGAAQAGESDVSYALSTADVLECHRGDSITLNAINNFDKKPSKAKKKLAKSVAFWAAELELRTQSERDAAEIILAERYENRKKEMAAMTALERAVSAARRPYPCPDRMEMLKSDSNVSSTSSGVK